MDWLIAPSYLSTAFGKVYNQAKALFESIQGIGFDSFG